jgi:hypothetical protein
MSIRSKSEQHGFETMLSQALKSILDIYKELRLNQSVLRKEDLINRTKKAVTHLKIFQDSYEHFRYSNPNKKYTPDCKEFMEFNNSLDAMKTIKSNELQILVKLWENILEQKEIKHKEVLKSLDEQIQNMESKKFNSLMRTSENEKPISNINSKKQISKEQNYSNNNLMTLLSTFEFIYIKNKNVSKNSKPQFDYYIISDFSTKTNDELYQQCYTQLHIFNSSYISYMANHKSYDFPEDFSEDALIKLLKIWGLTFKNDKFQILLRLLTNIVQGKDPDLSTYSKEFIIRNKTFGKKELTSQIGSVLAGVSDIKPIQSSNLGRGREENFLYKQNNQAVKIFNTKLEEPVRLSQQFNSNSSSYKNSLNYDNSYNINQSTQLPRINPRTEEKKITVTRTNGMKKQINDSIMSGKNNLTLTNTFRKNIK